MSIRHFIQLKLFRCLVPFRWAMKGHHDHFVKSWWYFRKLLNLSDNLSLFSKIALLFINGNVWCEIISIVSRICQIKTLMFVENNHFFYTFFLFLPDLLGSLPVNFKPLFESTIVSIVQIVFANVHIIFYDSLRINLLSRS